MAPHDVADESDGEDGAHHGLVSKHGLTGKRGQDVRRHPIPGRMAMYTRVAEEPEQVLPQQRRSAAIVRCRSLYYQSAGMEEARAPTGPAAGGRRGQQHGTPAGENAVVNHAHEVSGMRISDIRAPADLARRKKLRAVNSDPARRSRYL